VSTLGEVFLGVIAGATLAMAIVLVGLLVAAGRMARRVGRMLDQIERELTPLFGHLNAMGRDVSRAAAVATARVEQVDRAVGDALRGLDWTVRGLQGGLDGPAREGRAILSALAAGFRAMRRGATRPARREEDDALFI
jgi:hypothetical protein